MKICVLVGSHEHLRLAGVRIRYRRISDNLQEFGHDLDLVPIDELSTTAHRHHDVYIISKCHQANVFVVANLLKHAGKFVGVDLFDDYFSQQRDSRLLRYREWLRSLVPLLDFVLVSTTAMANVARTFMPGKAIHVMSDPSPLFDELDLKTLLRQKLQYFQETRNLSIAWFGIGDNPYFPVGLDDLVAFGSELGRFRRLASNLQIEILTNIRAMTPDNLAMLKRLPLPFTISEWSEYKEKQLLRRNVVTFLPVNAQSFSVAKSLNRAVSALCAGSQVLSVGYPLYEQLSPFIYRDPDSLWRDLEAGTLALRDQNTRAFLEKLKEFASSKEEAQSLLNFLDNQMGLGSSDGDGSVFRDINSRAVIIHGKDTLSSVHKLAQKIGALSIASPYAPDKLNYDVIFNFSPDFPYLDVFIADKHCYSLPSSLQSMLHPYGRRRDTIYQTIDVAQLLPNGSFPSQAQIHANSVLALVGSYPRVMKLVSSAVQVLFPGASCYYSEKSKIPLWVEPRAQQQGAR